MSATGGGHLEFTSFDYQPEEISPFEPQWVSISTSATTWNGTSDRTAKRQQKAKEFLQSWLTDQEYEDLQDGNLIIPSKIFPDRTYKLKGSASQMVEVYTSGILDHKLCVVAKDPRFENDDTILAKILMIKTNEKQFLKIAEKHPIHPDSGFGRYCVAFGNEQFTSFFGDVDRLTITWNLEGEIQLTSENSPQPGQFVTPDNIRLLPLHNDNN